MPSLVAVIVNCLAIWKHLSRPVLAMLKKEQKESRIKNLDLGNVGFVSRFRIRQMLREYRSGFAGHPRDVLSTADLNDRRGLLSALLNMSEPEASRTQNTSDMYTYKSPDEISPGWR